MVTVKMERIAAITAAKVLEQRAADYRKYVEEAPSGVLSNAEAAVCMADADFLIDAANALREGVA